MTWYESSLKSPLEELMKEKKLSQQEYDLRMKEVEVKISDKKKMRESWKRESWVGKRVEFTKRTYTGPEQAMGVVISDEDFRHVRIKEDCEAGTIWCVSLDLCREMKLSEKVAQDIEEFKALRFGYKNDKTMDKEAKEFAIKECNDFIQLMSSLRQQALGVEKLVEDVTNDRKEQAENPGKKKYVCGIISFDYEKKQSTHYYYNIWLTDEERKTGNYEIPSNGTTRIYKMAS